MDLSRHGILLFLISTERITVETIMFGPNGEFMQRVERHQVYQNNKTEKQHEQPDQSKSH